MKMKVNKMNNYKSTNPKSDFIFILCCQDECQELLTIEDAVKIALENNYAIKIAANELTIGKTNVSIGNAGMLPRATASIIDNNNIINLSQTRTDGTINSLDNAKIIV
jgi:outer membrane protein TolC